MNNVNKFSNVRQTNLFFALIKNFCTSSESMSHIKKEYDLVILGGGSGGLSCANEARSLGATVALLDYVEPSHKGTTWGLGGTCVNVGCIPKKLMHHAALLGEAIKDAEFYGWTKAPNCGSKINWDSLILAIQNHIKSLNWLTRVSLREHKCDYINAKGSFADPQTVTAVNQEGQTICLKAKQFVIAVGCRPKWLDIPGADLAITSDDLFSSKKPPGKTLIVGAGYIALECAGFLNGLGFDVTVMVREKVLRRFDRDMVQLLVENMTEMGIKFEIEAQLVSLASENNGQILVKYQKKGESRTDKFDTVLLAIGRKAATASLNLESAGVVCDPDTGKIPAVNEQTNVPHIYAVGDVQQGIPELTPVAIQSGKLLAKRLYGKSTTLMDYKNVATAIFTPLEYGCVGLSEQDAIKEHGIDKIEVYHSFYKPTEYLIPQKSFAQCYLKVVALKVGGKVLGMHFLGPCAGEVIQGYAVAIKCGVDMEHLINTVGIHPTVSEEFTRLFITKSSGLDPSPQICCS